MKNAIIKPANPETALKLLARETKTSDEEVTRMYASELARLETGARIRTFIPALALHKLRATLHKRRHSKIKR